MQLFKRFDTLDEQIEGLPLPNLIKKLLKLLCAEIFTPVGLFNLFCLLLLLGGIKFYYPHMLQDIKELAQVKGIQLAPEDLRHAMWVDAGAFGLFFIGFLVVLTFSFITTSKYIEKSRLVERELTAFVGDESESNSPTTSETMETHLL